MQNTFDNDSYIQKQRLLYAEKNKHLDSVCEKVSPFEFYRELFPVGSFERKGHYEDGKANGIGIVVQTASEAAEAAVEPSERRGNGIGLEIKKNGKAYHCTLTDELQELDGLVGKEFAIMSPVSYFGHSRTGKNARYLYALTFDLDGVDMPQLRDTLHQMKHGVIPEATFIVNSGNGLHLYYFLERPIPMYPQNQKFLKNLKYALTRRVWNRYTSQIKEPQIQGVLQGFRVVGSGTKLGMNYPVVAYRHGKAVSIEYLVGFIPDVDGERQRVTGQLLRKKGQLTLAEAKKKYPEWYDRRVVRGEKRGRWTVKRDLYDWWLRRIQTDIHVGHRFYGIMTLAIYAVKCGIDEETLRKDAYSLLPVFDAMSYDDTNRFTEDDVVSALEMYNESYVTFPRDDIAKYSGIQIPANKRNGRTQEVHLKLARYQKEMMKELGEFVNEGRPSKEQLIREYMLANPTVQKQVDIANALQIDRHTVSKYYKTIRGEMENAHSHDVNIPNIVLENGILVIRETPTT